MRLLDLFCGAGGAAVGYHRAGFDEIVGVDIVPQPRYPFPFVQADALEFLRGVKSGEFHLIHASPPCQAYSSVSGRALKGQRRRYPDLVEPIRNGLRALDCPFVIENVVGSPLKNAFVLCGSTFGLDIRRHRLFESSHLLLAPFCNHGWQLPRFRSLDSRRAGRLAGVVGVHGHLNYAGEKELRERAMGIDWMTPAELSQAIPSAYTDWIGRRMLEAI